MTIHSLRNARKLEDVAVLPRDNYSWGDWSLMTDGCTAWITKQAMGEAPTAAIEIPKGVFDRLVDAYIKPRKRER